MEWLKTFGATLILAAIFSVGSVLAQGTYSESMRKANQAYAEKNYDLARAFYQAAIDDNPSYAAAYQGLGNCLYYKGKKTEALKAFESSLSLNRNNPALNQFTQTLRAQLGMPPDIQEEPVDVSAPSNNRSGSSDYGESKSPVLAGFLSWVLPGVGQYYNGRGEDITKGVLIDAAVIGGFTMAVIGMRNDITNYSSSTSGLTLGGIGLIGTAQVFGIVDAILSADDINRKNRNRGSLGPGSDSNQPSPSQEGTGSSGKSFQVDIMSGVAVPTDEFMGFGFGGTLAGGFPLGGGLSLGGSLGYHNFSFSQFSGSVSHIEILASLKYRFASEGIRPFFRLGAGASIYGASYSYSQTSYPMVEGGLGLEFPVGSDIGLFVQARTDIVLGNYGTDTYFPIDFGISFGGR